MRQNLIGNQWDEILRPAFESEYYQNLRQFLKSEYAAKKIYPPMHDIYNAFKLTPPENTKVVILGQDPYINPNQAHGLAFSVQEGNPPPPSLVNIYKEIESDLGHPAPRTGDLVPWAKQGVLLLNTSLTVIAGLSNSHKGKGWEKFTDEAIKHLGIRDIPTVFLLWGRNARDKKALITNPCHLILEAPHPSPLSAHNGFFGCKHFSKTNKYLEEHNLKPIEWRL